MSPEQAAGKPIDKRSDIFSFGCVLFEMLAGARPFGGDGASEMVAAILKDEPEWGELPTTVPAALQRLLHRCLEKDPDRRIHDIADARIELEEAQTEPSPAAVPASAAPGSGPSWRLALSLVVIAGLLGTMAGVVGSRLATTPPAPPETHQLTLELEPGLRLWGGHPYEYTEWGFQRPGRTAIALSPDGNHLVYAATDGRSPRLYLRDMSRSPATSMDGTEGGFSPFFSPDGEHVGFFVPLEQERAHALKRVPLAGGAPRTVVDRIESPDDVDDLPFGAAWGADNTIVYSSGESERLVRVSGGGGEPRAVTDLAGVYSHRLPMILPGSDAIVFTAQARGGLDRARIVAQLPGEDMTPKVLIEPGSDARFSPTGHLLYMRAGSLIAVPFDSETLEATGTPARVAEDVVWSEQLGNSVLNSGAGQFAFSATGTFVYATGDAIPEIPLTIEWVNRRGEPETLSLPRAEYVHPRVSPSGEYLAYLRGRKGDRDIWVYEIASGTARQLTFDGGIGELVWSPDSTELAFRSGDTLYRIAVGETGPPTPLSGPGPPRYPASWSPRGFIAYVEDDDIGILNLEDGTSEPFVATADREDYPEFSPDGAFLAYSSDREGDRVEVFVVPFPGGGQAAKVSTEGGAAPVWSADGQELFYKRGTDLDREIWVANVRQGDTFDFDPPRPLLSFSFEGTTEIRNFDVHPDGRFVVIPPDYEMEPLPVTKLHVILNWFEELKRLAPAGQRP